MVCLFDCVVLRCVGLLCYLLICVVLLFVCLLVRLFVVGLACFVMMFGLVDCFVVFWIVSC